MPAFLPVLGKVATTFPKKTIYIVLGIIALIALILLIFISIIVIIFTPVASILGFGETQTYESSTQFSEALGILSEKYESNGNPGTISNTPGDPGGKSYGAWQIASKTGTMNSFINWVATHDINIYTRLTNAKSRDSNSYSSNFDAEWRRIAKENKDNFYYIQWAFIKSTHYDPVVKYFKDRKIIDFDKRSWTIRNVVWSTAVQHGPGSEKNKTIGAIAIIRKQDLKLSDNLKDDEKLIVGLYTERKKVNIHFANSTPNIKRAVYNRFIQEQIDALEMLNQELSSTGN